jgi:hypothetical protein
MIDLTPDDARSALADLDRNRAELATSMDAPFLRHFVFAVTAPAMVLAATSPRLIGLTALGLLMVVGILHWDRKRYGVFINGYRRGRTLPVTLALLLALMGSVFVAAGVREHGQLWIGYAAAAFAFVAALAASYAWQAAYKREMGA